MNFYCYDFIRKTRAHPNFDSDRPTLSYELHSDQEKLKVEFIGSANSTITLNDKIFTIGPPRNKVSFGEINILNNEQERIGFIDFFGWTFKRKKVVLLPGEFIQDTEEWTIEENLNSNGKEFWKHSKVDFEITNGTKRIGYLKERQKFSWKNIFNGSKNEHVKIKISQSTTNDLFLCGIVIYLSELIELNR